MKKVFIKIFIWLLILVVVFSVSAFAGYTYVTPVSTVKLGNEPSIIYSLNTFDIVISVSSSDNDIDYLVSNLDIRNKRISDSIQITLSKLNESGYEFINQLNESYVQVSNSSKEKEKKLSQVLETNVKNSLNGLISKEKLNESSEVN